MEAAIEDYGEDYYDDEGPLRGWMDGATMLHICAMEGSLEVMEYLLTLPEVDVNAFDGFSETPVFFAAFWGWYEVILSSINNQRRQESVFFHDPDDSNAHSCWG